jgi:Uma2 family endonuclease
MADDARLVPHDALPLRRFSRAEFDGMVERGMFREGERVELIRGIITSMMGEGWPHVDAVDRLADALADIAPAGLSVRVRTRLDIGEDSEVYPDILVEAKGTDPRQRSPANVLLLVEVSDTSLAADRKVKAAEYAAAGFREYWIVDVNARRLWIHRDPANGMWTREDSAGEEGAAPLFAPDTVVPLYGVLPSE